MNQEIQNEILIEKNEDKVEEIVANAGNNDPECSKVIENETTTEVTTVVTRRYNTRSSINAISEMTLVSTKRRRTISTENTPKLPKEPIKFIEYNGKVEYYTEFHDIAIASAKLL